MYGYTKEIILKSENGLWVPKDIIIKPNQVNNNLLYAAVRSFFTGHFNLGGTNAEPVTDMLFTELVSGDSVGGKKLSDDEFGIDIIDGGDGNTNEITFVAYYLATSAVTISFLQLGYNRVEDALETVFATQTPDTPLDANTKYIVEWTIGFPES